ncbi:MAG TPA: substrate-binding domain-containing protein, partial [Microlunatus sp.]|nr:substrate-binding domain-containing protein [Microlunatus sp.]
AAGGGGAVADTPRLTIAMVTHETPGDTFWDKIRKGAEAAAAKDNVELKYSNDPTASAQATLIQNAVDSKVDGIASTLVTPDALAPAVKAATTAGIPLVGFNSGIDQWKELGALMYFGSDENLAGATVGDKLNTLGAKHPLCVIQAQGSVALEARCAGVKAKVAATENLQVNGADTADMTATMQAKLQQDPSIDYVVTLGAPVALAALQSASGANSKAKIVTFDLNADAAKAIKDGQILFSVDQQPYLQGYEAVDSLWLYLTNRNVLGGGLPVLTGPSIVDENNIDAILTYAQNGTR